MGTRAREIVGLDVEEPLKKLNSSFASEWPAASYSWEELPC